MNLENSFFINTIGGYDDDTTIIKSSDTHKLKIFTITIQITFKVSISKFIRLVYPWWSSDDPVNFKSNYS